MELANANRGGMKANAKKYSTWALKVFDEAVSHRRKLIELPAYAEKGSRFNNNDSVLWRAESNYTEAEFMTCPGRVVDAMLLDAAKADYWYDKEKDYDDDGCDCETENDD